jgi:hypothetical protein
LLVAAEAVAVVLVGVLIVTPNDNDEAIVSSAHPNG